MAALVWQQRGMQVLGVNDPKVSPYQKCWIKQGNTCVVGIIGEGTSRELQANWNSPFESDSVGSQFQKTGGILQSGELVEGTRGMTSITTLASRQVWEGNQPLAFNISLLLYALVDGKREVDDAIQALYQFISPEVRAISPVGSNGAMGRIPSSVYVNIGRNAVYGPCVIENISDPLDAPRYQDGYLSSSLLNITIQSEAMLNRSDVPRMFG